MLSTIGVARRSGLVAFVLLATFLLSVIHLIRTLVDSQHYPILITAKDTVRKAESPWDDKQKMAICGHQGMHRFVEDEEKPRKVYDLFPVASELDWLWIRLNTLAPYVDYFVIVESTKTCTGAEKPLYVKDNWANLTSFHDKIIHTVVEDPGPSIGESTGDRERYLRNAMFDKVFPDLPAEKAANYGDVLMVSEVDEIPKPSTISILRFCHFPERYTLRSHFYHYSFQWMHVGEQWAHPQATIFKGLTNTIRPHDLREGISGAFSWWQKGELWDAAWHCWSCFATLKDTRLKMSSLSHASLDTPENTNQATMLERVRNGQDLFGRPDERCRRIVNNTDMPLHILELDQEYTYLLNRDGPDAGFRDVVREALEDGKG